MDKSDATERKIPAYHGLQCSGEGTGSGNKTRPSVTGGNDSRSQTTKGARPISSSIFPASTRLAFPCLVASRKVDCGRDSWRSTCSRPSYLPPECWAESHFLCSRCARFTSFRREETLRAGSSRRPKFPHLGRDCSYSSWYYLPDGGCTCCSRGFIVALGPGRAFVVRFHLRLFRIVLLASGSPALVFAVLSRQCCYRQRSLRVSVLQLNRTTVIDTGACLCVCLADALRPTRRVQPASEVPKPPPS